MGVLGIDIGNTDTVVAWFEEGIIKYTTRWPSKLNKDKTLIKIKFEDNLIPKKEVTNIVLSSVVPELNSLYEEVIMDIFNMKIELVQPAFQNFLKINTNKPQHLGSDLYLNALNATQIFPNSNCLILDFGTALTFTLVSKNKEILGVSIMPGLKTAIKSLFENTSLLPEVPLIRPKSSIGKNTEEAIQSGIILGYEGSIIHIIALIKQEFGEDTKVLITGGLSAYIEMFTFKYDYVNINHTLEGLAYFAELMKRIND